MAAGHAVAVMLIALGVGALLNAPSLRDTAERQPFGPRRTVATVAVAPLSGVSGLLRLDRPHRLLAGAAEELRGAGGRVAGEGGPGEAVSAQEPGEPRRVVTVDAPLRVLVLGDSLTEQLGPALLRRATASGVAEATHAFHYSSGLTRPDFYDWPAQAERLLQAGDPDVVVAMFGANDAQGIATDAEVLPFGTAGWQAAYRQRVGVMMDLLGTSGRTVVWVGQPVMRDPGFDERIALLNRLYAAEAQARPAVVYVDGYRALADPSGAYADYLVDGSGGRTLMRLGDGIHLSVDGAERLAGQVWAAIEERWSLRAAAA